MAEQWELMTSEDYGGMRANTHRLCVPGGWLYREQFWLEENEPAVAVALQFVPESRAEQADRKLREMAEGI